MPYPKPANDAARLEALRRYQILDTEPEQAFDDITELASIICRVPIALVTLVDGERQWFKSRVGLEITETPRELSFCTHAIMDHKTMVVNDALSDERFRNHPVVVAEPHVRFYAGAQLIDRDGYPLGTLCVVDKQPKELGKDQIRALEVLARQVMTQLELRRTARELADVLDGMQALQGLLPICAWCKKVRDDDGYWRSVEHYIAVSTGAKMTHCMCPGCSQKHAYDT